MARKLHQAVSYHPQATAVAEQVAEKDRRIATLEDACRAAEPTGTPSHMVQPRLPLCTAARSIVGYVAVTSGEEFGCDAHDAA